MKKVIVWYALFYLLQNNHSFSKMEANNIISNITKTLVDFSSSCSVDDFNMFRLQLIAAITQIKTNERETKECVSETKKTNITNQIIPLAEPSLGYTYEDVKKL